MLPFWALLLVECCLGAGNDFDYFPEHNKKYSPGPFFLLGRKINSGDKFAVTLYTKNSSFSVWEVDWTPEPYAIEQQTDIELHIKLEMKDVEGSNPQRLKVNKMKNGKWLEMEQYQEYPQVIKRENGVAMVTFYVEFYDTTTRISTNIDIFGKQLITNFNSLPVPYLITNVPCFAILRVLYNNKEDKSTYSNLQAVGSDIMPVEMNDVVSKLDDKIDFEWEEKSLRLSIVPMPVDRPTRGSQYTSCVRLVEPEKEVWIIWAEAPMRPFNNRDVGLAIHIKNNTINFYARADGAGIHYATIEPLTNGKTPQDYCFGIKVFANSDTQVKFRCGMWRFWSEGIVWRTFTSIHPLTKRFGPGVGYSSPSFEHLVAITRFKHTVEENGKAIKKVYNYRNHKDFFALEDKLYTKEVFEQFTAQFEEGASRRKHLKRKRLLRKRHHVET